MAVKDDMLRVAILDLYDGVENQGMRCIHEILHQYAEDRRLELDIRVFDVRQKLEIADLSFRVYIATGGPGSPLDSEGTAWEERYFALIRELTRWNASPAEEKKCAFFICHSFQLMCRYYGLGTVCKRKSPSYGVFPVHKWEAGFSEPLFHELSDPFYAVDSREWQVIEPNRSQFEQTGARLLALEKERPHVPLERALMAIRFSPYFVGTQFHPEADAGGMRVYLEQEDKKQQVIREHGLEKYTRMMAQLHDSDKIIHTQQVVLPAFLDTALNKVGEVAF